jgi:hypothetical protein
VTVSIAVPVPLVTEIAPREHVAAGFETGATLQVSARADGVSPPDVLIVTVDFAEAPGATGDGDAALAERLNAGAAMERLIAVEVLGLKLPSPL